MTSQKIKCPKCPKGFDAKDELDLHIDNEHTRSLELTPPQHSIVVEGNVSSKGEESSRRDEGRLLEPFVEVESKESDHRDLSSQEKRSTLTIDATIIPYSETIKSSSSTVPAFPPSGNQFQQLTGPAYPANLGTLSQAPRSLFVDMVSFQQTRDANLRKEYGRGSDESGSREDYESEGDNYELSSSKN